MLINGSFVTDKEKPGDIDACWSLVGVDLKILRASEPVLLDLSNHRSSQKAKFGCEFFPAEAMADEVHTFDEFFQFDLG